MNKANRFATRGAGNRSVILYSIISTLLMLTGVGCATTEDDSVDPQSEGTISGTVNGKDLSGTSGLSYYSSGILQFTAFLEGSASEGYLFSLTVNKPKVGTFSSKSGDLYGGVCRVAGSITTCAQDYDLTKTDESTIVFSRFDEQVYAEGTYSLIAKTKNGAVVTITNGKFRFKLTP